MQNLLRSKFLIIIIVLHCKLGSSLGSSGPMAFPIFRICENNSQCGKQFGFRHLSSTYFIKMILQEDACNKNRIFVYKSICNVLDSLRNYCKAFHLKSSNFEFDVDRFDAFSIHFFHEVLIDQKYFMPNLKFQLDFKIIGFVFYRRLALLFHIFQYFLEY